MLSGLIKMKMCQMLSSMAEKHPTPLKRFLKFFGDLAEIWRLFLRELWPELWEIVREMQKFWQRCYA